MSDICVIGDGWSEKELDTLLKRVEDKIEKEERAGEPIYRAGNPIYYAKKSNDAQIVGEITYRIRMIKVEPVDGTCKTWSGYFDEFIITYGLEGSTIIEHFGTGFIDPAICVE